MGHCDFGSILVLAVSLKAINALIMLLLRLSVCLYSLVSIVAITDICANLHSLNSVPTLRHLAQQLAPKV